MIMVDGGEDEFANEFLTITKGSDTMVLDHEEILKLMIETLDIHGWGWLGEELEEYLIYVQM